MEKKETIKEMPIFKVWKRLNFNVDNLSERVRLQSIMYILAEKGFSNFGKYKKDYDKGFYR